MAAVRDTDSFHDGHQDGFEPVVPIDLNRCHSVDDLVRAMSNASFAARNLGEAADVLEAMFRDEKCFRVLTISGALTVAKMQLIFIELVERGWIDAIVATGALMAHGFIEGAGMCHFKYRGTMEDTELFKLGYDRVYDTLELEKNFYDASVLVEDIFGREEHDGKSYTSPDFCRIMGKYLVDNNIGGASILKSAYLHEVPIFVPALSDSELGLDLISLRYTSREKARPKVRVSHDAFQDVPDFAELALAHERLGIFTLGGGVPRNWAQQVAPFLELKYEASEQHDRDVPRYHYGVRVCPEPVHWGGLSGCTYSEGMSWGKFVPEGRFAEVFADATLALPLLVRALMERFDAEA